MGRTIVPARPRPPTASAGEVTPAKVAADAVFWHSEAMLKTLDIQPEQLAAILRETAEWYDPQFTLAIAPGTQ